ncbi:hypothetical protein Taro_056010 [Colocasia esculenta]|uniref:HMA domain-containing protein n=1 Tax=Colocasia esculenta TaxID=4460 RepID=A0A843XV83_COLES|nr:hypothetical protein [Colocasia esculenta]
MAQKGGGKGDEAEKKVAAEKKVEGGEKKKDEGGDKKKDDGTITVVLKLDMHCEGCARKVRHCVKGFEGTAPRCLCSSPPRCCQFPCSPRFEQGLVLDPSHLPFCRTGLDSGDKIQTPEDSLSIATPGFLPMHRFPSTHGFHRLKIQIADEEVLFRKTPPTWKLELPFFVSRSIGVVSVSTDCANSKVTVVGKVDPWKLCERVESKTHKKVVLVSPTNLPKKGGDDKKGGGDDKKGGGDAKKGGDDKGQKKGGEDKKPKEPVAATVVLKIRLHCEGCIHRIRKTITKIKGESSGLELFLRPCLIDPGNDLPFVGHF